MAKHRWPLLIVLAAVTVLPGPVQAQSGSSGLSGGVLVGHSWPSDADLFNIRMPILDEGRQRISQAAIRDGGIKVGAWGTVRPASWPVDLRLSVSQVRGAEAEIVGGNVSTTPLDIGRGSRLAYYRSDLTISRAQVDAVVRPVGKLGPFEPNTVIGLAAWHHDFGPRELQRTVGAFTVEDTAHINTNDQTELGLHLGAELGVGLLGGSTSLRFGDYVSLDARMDGGRAESSQPEPFLRHDLYFAIGIGVR